MIAVVTPSPVKGRNSAKSASEGTVSSAAVKTSAALTDAGGEPVQREPVRVRLAGGDGQSEDDADRRSDADRDEHDQEVRLGQEQDLLRVRWSDSPDSSRRSSLGSRGSGQGGHAVGGAGGGGPARAPGVPGPAPAPAPRARERSAAARRTAARTSSNTGSTRDSGPLTPSAATTVPPLSRTGAPTASRPRSVSLRAVDHPRRRSSATRDDELVQRARGGRTGRPEALGHDHAGDGGGVQVEQQRTTCRGARQRGGASHPARGPQLAVRRGRADGHHAAAAADADVDALTEQGGLAGDRRVGLVAQAAVDGGGADGEQARADAVAQRARLAVDVAGVRQDLEQARDLGLVPAELPGDLDDAERGRARRASPAGRARRARGGRARRPRRGCGARAGRRSLRWRRGTVAGDRGAGASGPPVRARGLIDRLPPLHADPGDAPHSGRLRQRALSLRQRLRGQ